MPIHVFTCTSSNSWCGAKNGASLTAHGRTVQTPLGRRYKPLTLMRKMVIPIFAKFLVKWRHWSALHATFICVQIACLSILVMLMLRVATYLFQYVAWLSHVTNISITIMCCYHSGKPFCTTTEFGNDQRLKAVFALCTHALSGGWLSG